MVQMKIAAPLLLFDFHFRTSLPESFHSGVRAADHVEPARSWSALANLPPALYPSCTRLKPLGYNRHDKTLIYWSG
jgi:hypothetical protein